MDSENRPFAFDAVPGDALAHERFQTSLALAMKIAGSYSNVPGVELADVRQHARIALARAARAYDGRRGAPFDGLARVAVKNELRGLYRRQMRSREETTLDVEAEQSLDGRGSSETAKDRLDDQTADVRQRVANAEACSILSESIVELPEKMQSALTGILEGDSLETIGTGLGGISRQAVGRLATEAMRRLRGKLGERGVARVSDLLAQPLLDEQTADTESSQFQAGTDLLEQLMALLDSLAICQSQNRAQG